MPISVDKSDLVVSNDFKEGIWWLTKRSDKTRNFIDFFVEFEFRFFRKYWSMKITEYNLLCYLYVKE